MDVEDKILSFIDVEHLPEDMRYFANFIGIENIKTMMKCGGGFRVTIPQPRSFVKIALEQHLRTLGSKIDYMTKLKTAREFEVSENTINSILRQLYGESNDNQLSIL